MTSSSFTSDDLYKLLQNTYFDSIDNADAKTAVEAFNDDAQWVHAQVWEHDDHDRRTTDTLQGKQAIYDLLAPRIGEMQVVGIKYKVHSVLCNGKSGAFRAEVIGPEADVLPFFGW